ncbi:MAG: LacI family transcriptional regulator [Oscillochloris sp.]|nr:LacI family transcriptional regulator [Oscillochloris sp.]
MRDVAAVARVSIKTVSRVVNEESGVSAELVARVHDAIRLLGYQQNTTASNLRRNNQRTLTIGLLLDDVANPFMSTLHRAIEEVAHRHDTLVFAVSSDQESVREDQLIRAMAARRVDGMIIVPNSASAVGLQQFRRLRRPTVCVDRPIVIPNIDSVLAENRAGARIAIQHLAAYGHRRIAFLGDRETIWTATERYLGYIEALALEGLTLDRKLVRLNLDSIAAAEQATRDLLDAETPPTALFTGQNLITVGALRALQQHGLQQRVALVGFDDFLLADLLAPPVSVIAQNPAAMGQAAAELLFARLDDNTLPSRQIVIETQLLARGSGEIPAP